MRTCIGCRQRAERDGLLRVVADGPVIRPDPATRLPGRGAWLHPACLDTAERRRAFGRALRLDGAPDLSLLREWLGGTAQVTG